MNKEKIKGLLFDLDDTLMDSKKSEYNAICEFKKICTQFDNVNKEDFAKIWSKITVDVYEKYHSGKISFENLTIERMKKLFEFYSINISNEEAKEKFKCYHDIYKTKWILFDDTKQVLDNLKNKYKLAIITNGDGNQQRKKIELTGLNKYFSNIVISSEVGFSKPKKEIFEIACEKINLKPEDCVMIGDRFKVDVEGGLNYGMSGILVNRNKEKCDYKYQIENLSELIKFV